MIDVRQQLLVGTDACQAHVEERNGDVRMV